MKRKIFISLLFLVVQFSLLAQSNLNEIIEFADWLFTEQEYKRAATEYYRYLYLNPSANQFEIYYKIALAFFKAKDYKQALSIYEKLIAEDKTSQPKPEVIYELTYCYYKTANFTKCYELLTSYPPPSELLPPFILLKAANLLALDNLAEAAVELQSYLKSDGLDKEKVQVIYDLIKKEKPEVSPFWAGFFSTLLPGLGKIYAGRIEDGLISFSLVGLCTGLAIYSFSRDGLSSIMGWIYSTVGALFYLGNISGSVMAALQFNAEQKAKRDWQIKEVLNELFP